MRWDLKGIGIADYDRKVVKCEFSISSDEFFRKFTKEAEYLCSENKDIIAKSIERKSAEKIKKRQDEVPEFFTKVNASIEAASLIGRDTGTSIEAGKFNKNNQLIVLAKIQKEQSSAAREEKSNEAKKEGEKEGEKVPIKVVETRSNNQIQHTFQFQNLHEVIEYYGKKTYDETKELKPKLIQWIEEHWDRLYEDAPLKDVMEIYDITRGPIGSDKIWDFEYYQEKIESADFKDMTAFLHFFEDKFYRFFQGVEEDAWDIFLSAFIRVLNEKKQDSEENQEYDIAEYLARYWKGIFQYFNSDNVLEPDFQRNPEEFLFYLRNNGLQGDFGQIYSKFMSELQQIDN